MSMLLAFTLALAASLQAQAEFAENGARYLLIDGFRYAKCQSGDCQQAIKHYPTVMECGKACALYDGCRCAVYRPKDGYCSFKSIRCIDDRIGMTMDPTETHQMVQVARPPSEEPPSEPIVPIGRDGPASPLGGVKVSTMTIFQGFGIPYGGCGVPMANTVDDNGKMLPYIALNMNSFAGEGTGLFSQGDNCGRWLKITVGNPCGTPNDGSNMAACLADPNGGVSDGKDGTVIYGYVADSCADTNAWCGGSDPNHVDMGKENMISAGLADNWQNNRISWTFIDNTPPGWVQTKVEYLWCKDAKKDWLCVIAAGVSDGLSAVQFEMPDGSWLTGNKNWRLGQQWVGWASNLVAEFDGKYHIRALALDGTPYNTVIASPPAGVAEVTKAG